MGSSPFGDPHLTFAPSEQGTKQQMLSEKIGVLLISSFSMWQKNMHGKQKAFGHWSSGAQQRLMLVARQQEQGSRSSFSSWEAYLDGFLNKISGIYREAQPWLDHSMFMSPPACLALWNLDSCCQHSILFSNFLCMFLLSPQLNRKLFEGQKGCLNLTETTSQRSTYSVSSIKPY